jgi:DNA mismatch repair protein MutL
MESQKEFKPKQIKILSELNYNRIGSEQVIVSPVLIVKELVENSIDAKAKSISIVLEGNKTFEKIKVRDDGYGIPKDNLALLCKRFSTTKFDDDYDFSQISSLGYRGEALNFVSLNCKVSISSKSINSKVGYKAEFKDGAICRPAKSPNSDPVTIDPSQGQGTKIEVSEIFFCNIKRRDELNFVRDSEEIVKLIWKMAFYYRRIFFAVCRNEHLLFKNEYVEDEKTYFVNLLNFRFNKKLSADTFSLEEKAIEEERFKVKFFFSDPNVDLPKKTCVVFINGRLCKIEAFNKAVAAAYKAVSTSVNENNKAFFVYLDLQLDTSTESNYLDVNSCPKKQNIALRNHEKIVEYVRVCLEKYLRENRNTIPYKDNRASARPSQMVVKKEEGDGPASTVPYVERSDPNRIKLSSVFAEQKLDGASTIPNSVSDETKKDFLLGLVKFSDSFLDFFKRVELVGVKNAYTLLVQYETLLLQLDMRNIIRRTIEYKLIILDKYIVTGGYSIDLSKDINDLLMQGIELGLVAFKQECDDSQIFSIVRSRLAENQELLLNLGCELSGDILRIKTLDFLDHFNFYKRYYFLFLLKVCSGPGSPREVAELLGYFFLLNIDDFAGGENPEDSISEEKAQALRHYYELYLLEAKREEFCTEIDLKADLDPIVDLEHTYKTFERC